MSEIKGQLLGIVLTIAVFSAVFAIMVSVAQKSANSVSEKMETQYNLSLPTNDGKSYIEN